MSFQQTPFLFIDCQTTGMHPSLGELLELSWCVSSAGAENCEIKSRLLRVDSIPSRVREVTGIRNSDLVDALDPEAVRAEFIEDISKLKFESAVIHYAQFEKAWLLDFLGVEELPFRTLCTHAISKRLMPNVPSRNIRALSGYFGSQFSEVKRSAQHLKATLEIWKGLSLELEKNSILDLESVDAWLKNVKAKKPAKYEYNIDKEWRLSLPKGPGIYRMFAKNGEILYVGKATSLKDRVNSYFRGMRGREKRKLEMMAQAWKIEVTECDSALEAALLESDEIKKHDPPYNVALKAGNKNLIYYSRDFSLRAEAVDEKHTIGPFRRFNAIDDLLTICRYQKDGDSRGVFYDLLSPGELAEGFEEFSSRWPVLKNDLSFRQHLALGFRILRKFRTEIASEIESDPSIETGSQELELAIVDDLVESNEEELTPSEVADKFERAYMRAASSLLRARRMTRLLNCEVRWQENDNWKSIAFTDGKICSQPYSKTHTPFSTYAWRGLGIIDFDRMSVLDTSLQKVRREFTD